MNPKEILGYCLVGITIGTIIYMIARDIGWRDTIKVLSMSIGAAGAIVIGVYLITGAI